MAFLVNEEGDEIAGGHSVEIARSGIDLFGGSPTQRCLIIGVVLAGQDFRGVRCEKSRAKAGRDSAYCDFGAGPLSLQRFAE